MAAIVNQYFLIEPNWERAVLFKKQWNTSIQRSIDNEVIKRSALFTWPRRTLSFVVEAFNYTQVAFIKRAIYRNLENIWGVPLWQDISPLTSEAASGQAILNCDTIGKNFEVGGECILYADQENYFVGTILSKTDSSVTINSNLIATWSEGASVFPILKARIGKRQNINYITDRVSEISIKATEEFDSVTRNIPSVVNFPVHKDIPVFNIPPDWTSPIEEDLFHDYKMLQFLGKSQSWDEWADTDFRYKALFYGADRAESANIIDFFDYHKGRWKSFWRPTWFTDIKLTAAIPISGVVLEIEDIEFASYWESENAATWIMIIYPDNSYCFRAIKSVIDSTHIVIHKGLSVAISSDEVNQTMISFLSFCIFNQDEIEAKFITNDKTDFKLSFQNVSFDQPSFTTTTTSSTTTSTSSSSTSSSTTTSTSSSTTSSTSTTTSTSTSSTTSSSSSTTTTVAPLTEHIAKSFIADIATNWGDSVIGIRSIEFKLEGTLVTLAAGDITCYVSTYYNPTNLANMAFITSLSKTGDAGYTSWAGYTNTNQRLTCVFDTEITFDEIVINNYHWSGGFLTRGVKAVKMYVSTDTITSTTYGAAISNSLKVFDGTIDKHSGSDAADDDSLTIIF